MRRKDKEITDRKIINEIIAGAKYCHLALSDGDSPYIVPLNFGRRGNSIYFHSALTGRKLDIMRKNNKVCVLFEVDQEIVDKGKNACRWSTKYRSVMGFGRASIIEDDPGKREGLAILMSQYYNGSIELNDKSVSECLIIRVDIDYFTGKSSGY